VKALDDLAKRLTQANQNLQLQPQSTSCSAAITATWQQHLPIQTLQRQPGVSAHFPTHVGTQHIPGIEHLTQQHKEIISRSSANPGAPSVYKILQSTAPGQSKLPISVAQYYQASQRTPVSIQPQQSGTTATLGQQTQVLQTQVQHQTQAHGQMWPCAEQSLGTSLVQQGLSYPMPTHEVQQQSQQQHLQQPQSHFQEYAGGQQQNTLLYIQYITAARVPAATTTGASTVLTTTAAAAPKRSVLYGFSRSNTSAIESGH